MDWLRLLSRAWAPAILVFLEAHPDSRFSDLSYQLHVSGRQLSERLQELGSSGLLMRLDHPDGLRTEYRLTERGCKLARALAGVVRLAEEFQA